ncbi:MAG TPA: GtrA family protein [Candidatus Fimivicinus intestinavium]|nr:GtrA family protein [Candidatus Fimivicinus intestinavium]
MKKADGKNLTATAPENPPRLTKKQNILQAVKFALFSASAGIIQFVSFTLLHEVLKLPYWPGYLTALVLSVLWNFTFNRKYTFKSANNVPVAMLKVACFYLVFTPLSTWWGDALVDGLGWNEYLVLAGTMLINFVTEFLYDRFFVFRKSINTNELGKKEQEKLAEQAAHQTQQ